MFLVGFAALKYSGYMVYEWLTVFNGWSEWSAQRR